MPEVVTFTDALISQLEKALCTVPPERGAALVGAAGLVHHLVEDVWGAYSPVRWQISEALTGAVQEEELAGRGRFCGTVHSHPSGTPDPSSQDLRSTRSAIEANPTITSLAVCVITEGSPRPADLAIGQRHRMSVHLAVRTTGDSVSISRVEARVAPVHADLEAAGVEPVGLGRPLVLDGEDLLFHPVGSLPNGAAVLVGFRSCYPSAGPVFATVTEGRLTRAASGAWEPDWERAAQLRAGRVRACREVLPQQLDRIEPLAGTLSDKTVLVVGLGSVGSRLFEDLVRAGAGSLILVDSDPVEAANLTRTIYTIADVGTPKVSAAMRRGLEIAPTAQVQVHQCTLQGLSDLDELCRRADLVIGATDDPAGQRLLSHSAYYAGTPFLSVGIYKRALAGEIVLSHPAYNMACLSCSIGGLLRGAQLDTDYGTGQLVGELALGPAIHLVCEQAALAAIGVLAGPDRPAGETVLKLLETGRSLGLVASSPSWEIFEAVFSGMETYQFAPQSIWPKVDRNPDCPVCGEHREPPTHAIGDTLNELLGRLGRVDSSAVVGVPVVSTATDMLAEDADETKSGTGAATPSAGTLDEPGEDEASDGQLRGNAWSRLVAWSRPLWGRPGRSSTSAPRET